MEQNEHVGDFLKALILVCGLKKVKNINFYERSFDILEANIENVSIKNVLTICETLCYNKLILKMANKHKFEKIL